MPPHLNVSLLSYLLKGKTRYVYIRQPTQTPNANSSVAKKTSTPATTIAETLKFKKKSNVITRVIKNPIRAANIFGALSIFFSASPSSFNKIRLTIHTGLYFPPVKALIKKSNNKITRNTGVLNRNDEKASKMVKNAFSLVNRSLVFSVDTGHIKSIMVIIFRLLNHLKLNTN